MEILDRWADFDLGSDVCLNIWGVAEILEQYIFWYAPSSIIVQYVHKDLAHLHRLVGDFAVCSFGKLTWISYLSFPMKKLLSYKMNVFGV